MKKFALVIVLLALCIPALAVDMPNMIGNWTGTFNSVGYLKNTNWMFTGNSSIGRTLILLSSRSRMEQGSSAR
jgi:hypothetical protein